MFSTSKIPLSEDIASAIVKQHFGSNHSVRCFEELKEGYFNAAAMIELDDGLKCVMKAAPPPHVRVLRYENDIMRAEVESMRLVRQRTDIPVPKIYGYDTSKSLLDSEYFLMSYLPGIPLNKLRKELPEEASLQIDIDMGRMTREMSEITGEAFGYWALPEAPGVSWRVCYEKMLRGIFQDGLDMEVDLSSPYEEIFRQLEAHFDALDEVRTPQMVHWDLWDGNVFIDPANYKITGLIDFERVLWGDPLIEAFFGGMDANSGFAKGYGNGILTTRNQRRRRLLYNGYLFLIMVIECYYRAYETKDQENWARKRLNETLEGLRAIE
jgi:aminoglycoside phosphotransferase (APT) family kinase protein